MARGIENRQLDSDCPLVEEDDVTRETSSVSLAAFEKFVAQHMTSHG